MVLGFLSDPNYALAVTVLGMFLIYWELLRPGLIVPGAIGSILCLLGIRSVTVTWAHSRPDGFIAFLLLCPWGIVTAFLLGIGRRARRNKSVESLSRSLRN